MGSSPLRSCICMFQRGPLRSRSEPRMDPSPLRSCICMVARGRTGAQNGPKSTSLVYMQCFAVRRRPQKRLRSCICIEIDDFEGNRWPDGGTSRRRLTSIRRALTYGQSAGNITDFLKYQRFTSIILQSPKMGSRPPSLRLPR